MIEDIETAIKREMIPKSEWGPGPWQEEPDRLEFEYKGFHCLARRAEVSGAWCGYVAVPPGHPWFEKNYDEVEVYVHWGLTYAGHCNGPICHLPKPGEPDNVWWLGFDCAHCDDLMPGMNAQLRRHGGAGFDWGVYRDLDYVRNEIKKLADQIAANKNPR